MGEKSHVGMLHELCPICEHVDKSKSSVLLDRGLRNSLEKDNYVLGEVCESCQSMLNDNRVALVVTKGIALSHQDMLKPEEADRSGEILWMRKSVAERMFNAPIQTDMLFIDSEVRAKLKEIIGSQIVDELKVVDIKQVAYRMLYVINMVIEEEDSKNKVLDVFLMYGTRVYLCYLFDVALLLENGKSMEEIEAFHEKGEQDENYYECIEFQKFIEFQKRNYPEWVDYIIKTMKKYSPKRNFDVDKDFHTGTVLDIGRASHIKTVRARRKILEDFINELEGGDEKQ